MAKQDSQFQSIDEYVIDQYVVQERTLTELSKELHRSDKTLKKLLVAHGVIIRSGGRYSRVKVGDVFGQLVVKSKVHRLGTALIVECLCDPELDGCGQLTEVPTYSLVGGKVRSCGCLSRERLGKASITHGLSDHYLYGTWEGMHNRCSNPSNDAYYLYGARGISVDDRYAGPQGFPNFLEDVGERPPNPSWWKGKKPYYSLDRIDNSGNYEPGNLHWATPSQQNKNRRARKEWKNAQAA